MKQLRTYFMGAALAVCAAQAAPAMPADPQERARAFATCLGRYSAAMEHDWLVGTDADAARARRDLFATLLEAVTPEAQSAGVRRSELLSYRIGAKNAQSRLMEMASFHADDRRARTAANVARRQIGMCDSLVLG